MMIKNKFLTLAVLALVLAACANDQSNGNGDHDNTEQAEGTTRISGLLKGAKSIPVYFEKLNANSIDPIDTVMTDENGTFSTDLLIEQLGFYRLALNEQNACVLILEPGGKVELNADVSNIYETYKVIGSEESQRLKDLNEILGKRDSVGMAVQDAQMTQNKEKFESAMAAYQAIQVDMVDDIKKFIDEKPASLSSLAAIQNLDSDADLEYYKKVVDALEGKVEGNDFYEAMKFQVEKSQTLAVGSEAPEIALPQPNGQELKLSDLRGQYVLVDFWASWCGPCRRENPNVVRVYEKYHDKGFEILGVSLDKNSKAWLQAIEQDGLKWKHISDLKYWKSEVVPEYQIQGIPLTYLIDPEGKIVAKNLRGSALEEKLAEIYN
ncbi:MAG: TlpA disulfide reductase family protein [Salibacteraceae bacterium]